MSGLLTRRRVAAVTAVLGLTATMLSMAAVPASAGSMSFSKSSGTTATVEWLEVGELPAPVLGNAHLGYLFVEDLGRGNAQVFGGVEDFDCPPGVLPTGGGHGEEPPEGETCVSVDFRYIEAGEVTFTMDRKFSQATLTGTLLVFGGHDGQLTGTPPVNMTWTGSGDSYSSRVTETFTDDWGTYTYRYNFSGRDSVVTGRIGPMIFDDEPGEYSFSSMGSYRNFDRSRSN